VLCQQSQCHNDCRHVPRSSRKGRDALSPVKVEYQTVEVFHGEILALSMTQLRTRLPSLSTLLAITQSTIAQLSTTN